MANPATIADIEARWRPLSDQETTNANAFLGDAWALLLSRRPNLEDDIAAGTVTSANVIRVVCAMVLRILKNPDAWDQETIDDWSGRRNALTADGILRVTPDELADITPGRATRKSVRLVVYGDA
jgi:hypothetical protein